MTTPKVPSLNFSNPKSLGGGGSMSARTQRAAGAPGKIQLPLQPASARGAKKSPSDLIAESASGMVRHPESLGTPQIVDFLNLSSYSHQMDSAVSVDLPLFKPTPQVVAFSNYEGLQSYDATLTLRNQDNVARRIQVLPPDSSFFEILPGRGRKKDGGGSARGDKVAPGMEVSYIIRFTPDCETDYSYDLIVITERERFIVPIRASGGSAVLELPDVIEFGPTPVKYQDSKTILVRNIGQKATKFLLQVPPPFSSSIVDGYLEVGGSLQVDIFFRPDRVGSYERELRLQHSDD
jgi:hydrocephalus-inducing protein